MVEIKLENVSKSVNRTKVVDSVSLLIPDGAFCCILGPPGSGKTMLMRLIAGLDLPDEGKILFDGEDVTSLEPAERGVAVVFQDFALYPHLTVFDNIASPLKAKKLSKPEIVKKVNEVAKYLKMSHRLTHYPAQLSGGERQRVAIARAIVKDAKLILLDEPLIRLDYKIREDMRAELGRIQKELGRTVILITSDPIDALALGEVTAIMLKGRIVQSGSMNDIYERPANVFVGRYFGVVEMNILKGKVLEEKGRQVLEAGPIQVELGESRLAEEEVWVGIRPEHVSVMELTGRKDVTFKGKIILTEVIGSDTVLHMDVGGGEPLRAFIPEIYKKEMGEEVELTLDARDLYIFSKRSETLIARGAEIVG